MDEPFGALDPITRARLQQELLRIQHEVGKTIVFVTHDIDEAILLGDRIAILREGGVLAQYDTPERLLARPADDFVVRFLGADRGLKLLALRRLDELELGPLDGRVAPTADASTTLRDALSQMIVSGARSLLVLGHTRDPRGVDKHETHAAELSGRTASSSRWWRRADRSSQISARAATASSTTVSSAPTGCATTGRTCSSPHSSSTSS
jgi:ABC-type proline/glycine betaine transport system ATPase subunit